VGYNETALPRDRQQQERCTRDVRYRPPQIVELQVFTAAGTCELPVPERFPAAIRIHFPDQPGIEPIQDLLEGVHPLLHEHDHQRVL
jgi:hypothetical protein